MENEKSTKKVQKLVGVISLGCDKNRVDTETMMTYLAREGYGFTSDSSLADIIIVNTCSFINSGREEGFEAIEEMVEHRKNGNCSCLVITGCYPQIYLSELQNDFPEVDIFLGVNEYRDICKIIKAFYADKERKDIVKIDSPPYIEGIEEGRLLTTPQHYAYVKIADGCNNFCSYCIIPYIRGRFRSRKIESIVAECKDLVKNGVKEIILVAQDTSNYGIDIYKERRLVDLINEITKIEELKWLRILYVYPENIDDKLLKLFEENPKVCAYIDVPFQHINNEILKSMNRKVTKEVITEIVEKLQSLNRFIAVRSTFIVGYPGETKAQFKEILTFLQKYRLPNVGFFAYSREDGTVAGRLENQIDEPVKHVRLLKAIKSQKGIVKAFNKSFVGKDLEVVVEGQDPQTGYYFARSEYQAPDIDTIIYIDSAEVLKIGEFYNCRIIKVKGYDLYGTIV